MYLPLPKTYRKTNRSKVKRNLQSKLNLRKLDKIIVKLNTQTIDYTWGV